MRFGNKVCFENNKRMRGEIIGFFIIKQIKSLNRALFCYKAGRKRREHSRSLEYVVVNFLSQLIFIFPLFLCMIMNANEFETKEI